MKLTSDDQVNYRVADREQLDAELYLDAEKADLSEAVDSRSLELSTQELRLLLFALTELCGRDELANDPRTRGFDHMFERLQCEVAQRELSV